MDQSPAVPHLVMSDLPKGAILIWTGTRLDAIEPGADGESFVYDSQNPKGARSRSNTVVTKITPDNPALTSSTSFAVIATFVFPGSNTVDLASIKILAKKHTSITNYTVRIYDLTNNNTITEATFTNDMYEVNDLGTLNNIPTGEATWEVQIKQTGGNTKNQNSKVYFKEANLYYH